MAGQVGWKTESTWGTAVTVDTFAPVLSANMTIDEGYMRSEGIRAGRLTRDPAKLGAKTIGTSVEMELYNTSLATLLKHYFGTVTTTGAGPYTHTYTPGTPLSKSLTVQVGIEDTAGTVQPFTLFGAKIGDWSISANVGELAKTSFEASAKDYTTATAIATASYAAALDPFTFVQATISANGSAVTSAKSVTLSGTKGLKTDRRALGSRTILEQLKQDHYDFTTEITADFENLTLFNLIAAGTQVASVLTFDNGTQTLTITCSGQIVGDPPSLTNPGIEEQTIRIDHSNGTNDANTITAVLVNSETSAS